MLYYRYRPGSAISLKELMYDEMYFCSTKECNDPYEGKSFAVLDLNQERWENLIRNAIRNDAFLSNFSLLIEKLARYFTEKGRILVDKILNSSFDELFEITDTDITKDLLKHLYEIVKGYINLYVPDEQYFVSFSKTDDNILMWSHYANNHQGYCLVFRARDNKLYQEPLLKKTSFAFSTPNSFAPGMSFSIPESFEFQDMEYIETPTFIDGSKFFPKNVAGENVSQEALDDFKKDSQKIYLRKHSAWSYEEESRTIIQSGIPWLAGQRLTLSPIQRLFHYDSTQLVGIILGARMRADQRSIIKEIVAGKVKNWDHLLDSSVERIISDFVIFEEVLSESTRKIEVKPLEIYTGLRVYKQDDDEFKSRLNRWKEGEALHYSGNKCSRIKVE